MEKMKKAFDGFENIAVVSVSPWLSERAKQSPIFSDKKHYVVLNGLNTDVFKYEDSSDLRLNLGITDERIVFHVAPTFNDDRFHNKGGRYVLQLAREMESENVKFIVAGEYDPCIVLPSNVILLDKVKDQGLLAKYYSLADATIIASRTETFSMVAAESLCCGTPIVGFKCGAPEQIAIPEYSTFTEYGDVAKLKENLKAFLNKKIDKRELSTLAAEKYGRDNMSKKYLEIYEENYE